MENEEKVYDYPKPELWQKLMRRAVLSNFTDVKAMIKLAEIVISYEDKKESDNYMICKLEFTNNIPERFYYLID